MFYRKLGKTDLEVSNLGFGCMRLPHKEHFYEIDEVEAAKMFDYAIEHGVNCMDLYSPNPDMQKKVGAALGDRRKDFIIFAGTIGIADKAVEKMIEKIVKLKDKYIAMCRDSYMPDDMKF